MLGEELAEETERERDRVQRYLYFLLSIVCLGAFGTFFFGVFLFILRTHSSAHVSRILELPPSKLAHAPRSTAVALMMYTLVTVAAIVGVSYFSAVKSQLDLRAIQIGDLMVPLGPDEYDYDEYYMTEEFPLLSGVMPAPLRAESVSSLTEDRRASADHQADAAYKFFNIDAR